MPRFTIVSDLFNCTLTYNNFFLALAVLNLNNCPLLRTPPKEIRDQGMKTTIAYLKRLSQGSRAVYQTKLMVVGLGGVGKTRLVFRILFCFDSVGLQFIR
jgi:hypothetical protein